MSGVMITCFEMDARSDGELDRFEAFESVARWLRKTVVECRVVPRSI